MNHCSAGKKALKVANMTRPGYVIYPSFYIGHHVKLRCVRKRCVPPSWSHASYTILRKACAKNVHGPLKDVPSPTTGPKVNPLTEPTRVEREAKELWKKYDVTGDPKLLHDAILLLRKVLNMLPQDYDGRDGPYSDLASLLATYFQCTGDVAALDEAIELNRAVLEMRPVGDPSRAMSLSNMAIIPTARCETSDEMASIKEGVHMLKEGITLKVKSNQDYLGSCSTLVSMLSYRYQVSGNLAILDEAIHISRGVLKSCPDKHPERGTMVSNLGSLLQIKYESVGNLILLEEALQLHRDALALSKEGEPDRTRLLSNLAGCLGLSYQARGELILLDEVIELEQAALRLRPRGHPGQLLSYGNIAIARKTQYDVLGNHDLLDEAIGFERMALELTPDGHSERATSCSSLATSLGKRFQSSGDTILLDECIELEREALRLRPDGHADRVSSCGNLAVWLHMRYSLSKNLDDLHEAVGLMRTALALMTPGNPHHAMLCTNLSVILRNYHGHVSQDSSLLDEAVQLTQKALDLRPVGDPNHATACIAHAISILHRDRFQRDGSRFEEIEVLCHKALPLQPAHRTWIPMLMLADISVTPHAPRTDIDKAIEFVSKAVSAPLGNVINLVNDASSVLNRIHTLDPTANQCAELLPIYTRLMEMLPLLAGFALDRRTQLRSQLPVSNLGSDAVACAIASGDLHIGLELLEQSRGVMWSQALHVSDPQTYELPESLRVELHDLLVSMATDTASKLEHSIGARGPSTSDLRHRRAIRIQAILSQARSMPGLERFMLGDTSERLMQAAKDHPVIILLSTRRECYALVIRNETTLSHVPLVIKPEDVSQLWSMEEGLMSRGYAAQQRSFMISKAKTLSKAE
jgi:tetratricopeptide (TPR) repeat protein